MRYKIIEKTNSDGSKSYYIKHKVSFLGMKWWTNWQVDSPYMEYSILVTKDTPEEIELEYTKWYCESKMIKENLNIKPIVVKEGQVKC